MRICVAVLAIAIASSAFAATVKPVASFGENPGALAMYEYVPDNLPAGRPLVVVLHGCTQMVSAMNNTGWNKLADQHGFAVVYPEQSTSNNPVRCFNWAGEHGDPANLERGKGENQSIISMIDAAIATHKSDPKRVYVVGFSAGGAFAAVMLATWPERFAAGAIMSGVPYRCATTVNGAYSCQSPGVSKTATQWGDLVRAAATHAGARPPVQIWHGSTDGIVKAMNADELVKQWTDAHGTDATADATDMFGPATRSQYKHNGKVVVESYIIAGMGHGIAIGNEGMATCPSTVGAYFLDVKVCSMQRAAEFFGLTSSAGGGGNGDGSGSGSGSGSDTDGDGEPDKPSNELPGCSLDAGNAGRCGLGAFAVFAIALLLRRRRR